MALVNWNQICSVQTLEQYLELGDIIGKGTFGTVFKAWIKLPENSKQKKTYIAVKQIRLPHDEYNEYIQAYKQENDFLKDEVNHPNIMKVYFHFEHLTKLDKNYYIGMEYGFSDLNSIIKHKDCSTENEVAVMAQQIWNGLNYLQNSKTAHRDLKPENIILTEDGTYKLCDFGEVKFSQKTLQTTTQPVKGTPPYLAPELFTAYKNNQRIVNCNLAKADTFSFGVVLLQTILGCEQFGIEGINENPQMSQDLIRGNVFSESFTWFLDKCLKFNPNERWTFNSMKKIFELNTIEAYYQLEQKDIQILNLQNEINRLKKAEEQTKSLENQIRDLKNQNQQLQQQLIKSQNELNNLLQYKERKIIKKDVEQIKDLLKKSLKELKNTIKTTEDAKVELEQNSNLKFVEIDIDIDIVDYFGYFGYYNYYKIENFVDIVDFWTNESGQTQQNNTYWRLNNGTPLYIQEQDIPKAIGIVKKMQSETGYKFAYCLMMLHFNLWNYEKSKNHLLY